MRKALILLVVFAVVGAAAFADVGMAKWAITTNYGLGIISAASTTVVPFDWAQEGQGRTRLGFTYTSADGNAGFNSRLQMVGPAAPGAAVFNQLNGWGKFFGGALTVRAGLLDDYTIATKDWWCYGNTDGQLGMYFNFSLVPGLDIGFLQKIPVAAIDIADLTNGDILGVSYAMTDIGSIQLGAILSSTRDATHGTAIYAGFSLTAVTDLKAIIEAKFSLYDGSTPVALNEMVSYAMGAFTVGARIGEYLDGSNFYWGVEPTATYKIDDNFSVSAIVNAYSAPMNDNLIWTSGALYAGLLNKGAAGDVNFGAGASVSYAASGFTLTVGDYFAALDSQNIFYINADVSL